MGRGEVPKKRRDIRTQENRDPVILEIPRIDLSRKSREDTCQRSAPSGKVPIERSLIGNRDSGNRESRGQGVHAL
jgi:hypothetical protein